MVQGTVARSPRAKRWRGAAALSAGVGLYLFLPPDCPEPARRMALIFVVGGVFWAFEILPLFATGLLVIVLEIVLLGWPRSQGAMIPPQVFLSPWSHPVLMLFFGGFALAAAMHKHRLDVLMMSRLLPWFGHRPFSVLVGFMAVTVFFSMWLSNTATAALMFLLVRPLLDQSPKHDPFAKALVLAIAFGANIGGMGTPVGTPPNAMAAAVLSAQGVTLRFLDWMTIAVPIMIVISLFSAGLLFILFRPERSRVEFTVPTASLAEPGQRVVLVIFFSTVLLWMSSGVHRVADGLVALGAAAALFCAGSLDRHDLKHLHWDILILMWGGLAMGEGFQKSGLADWMMGFPIFHGEGLLLIAGLSLAGLFLSTFMSNTAAASVLLPLATALPNGDPLTLAVAVSLSCSLAVMLPISTPPNAMAFATGAITTRDMLKAGCLISIVSVALVILACRVIVPLVAGR